MSLIWGYPPGNYPPENVPEICLELDDDSMQARLTALHYWKIPNGRRFGIVIRAESSGVLGAVGCNATAHPTLELQA